MYKTEMLTRSTTSDKKYIKKKNYKNKDKRPIITINPLKTLSGSRNVHVIIYQGV